MVDEPDVRYGLEVIGDKIPGRDSTKETGGKVRYSPLRDRIETIRATEEYWHKWIAIADYGSGNVAGGAMRDLKHHYGEIPEVNGFSFTTHRYAIKDAENDEVVRDDSGKIVKRCKLLVRYDREKINPERRLQWERDKIMVVGREAAKKLGIDVDNISPEPRPNLGWTG